ncbi:TetR/AcrR family transcriptional regulator [Streptococcus agalactiae]
MIEKYTDNNLKFVEAISRLLCFKNFKKITVSDLAREANLSRRTFYNYYSSKNEFYNTAVYILLDEITKILNSDPTLGCEILTEMFTFIYKNKNIFFSFVINYPNIKRIIKEYIEVTVVYSAIPNLRERLEIYYKIPYDYALELYILTIESIILKWIENNFDQTPERIASFIVISTKI